MTSPGIPSRLPDLLAQRDSSLPLAAAALARIADEWGRTTFGDLAVAYREEFLQLRAHTRGASLPELGGLSLEDFRNSLRSSVLPRLGVMKVVRYPVGPLLDDAPVACTRDAWAELLQEAAGRGAAADRLLQAAQLAITRAEPSSGAYQKVAGASVLEAQGLIKSYKGRRVVNDVSVRLEQGEIVGLLGPNGAGKTTTFYMITGLIRPDRGRIALNGRDVTTEPMYQRPRPSGSSSCSTSSPSGTCGARRASSCRGASGGAWRSRAPSSQSLNLCCWTSRSPGWTPSPCTTFRRSWRGCATAASAS